jgi:hypothetical protein
MDNFDLKKFLIENKLTPQSQTEGFMDMFKKKEQEGDYVTLPKWQGKNNVTFKAQSVYPSSDMVRFYIGKDGIDDIIAFNKTVKDNRAKVFTGNNSTVVELDQAEADRIRNKYNKK